MRSRAIHLLNKEGGYSWPTGRAPRLSLVLFGSLRDNNLGPQGGVALAKGLEGNATLTSLECAAMPCTCHIRKVLGLADQRQQPMTLVGQPHCLPCLAGCGATVWARKVQQHSQRRSRAIRR